MYCPECGYQNSDASHYCARCGGLILPEASASQTTMSFAPIDAPVVPSSVTEQRAGAPALVVRSGDLVGKHFEISGESVSIGRSSSIDVLLDDITVSREHARIVRRPDGYYIEDSGSLNGTYVNHRRVESHHLADGDELQIGKFKLTFLSR